MTTAHVLARLRREVRLAGSQMALARRIGVSVSYLSDVLRRRRQPGDKILAPLGLARRASYQPTKKGRT